MPTVIIQAGHCHRKTGVVGTRSASGFTEQQFTWPTANRAAELLKVDGHDARVILADPPASAYAGDAFVAIHADGNNNPTVKGASVGYRTDEGKALAMAWKSAYRSLGWATGFRGDNYTSALGGYYGVKRAVAQGNRRACIIEAGFLTNPQEAAELSSPAGQDRCARAIRAAVNAALGLPAEPTPAPQEDDMHPRAAARIFMRVLLGRGPKDEAELKFHATEVERLGQEPYITWLEVQPEAQAWARKIGAEVRTADKD